MIKVATINPPFLKNYSRQSRSPSVAKSGTIYYSYYLAYAGASMESKGHNVKHIDAISHDLSEDSVLKVIAEFSPSLIIFDTSTPSIISDIKFACRIKNILPNCLLFAVGTFPSKNTIEFQRLNNKYNAKITGCLIGEYEETSVEVANAVANESPINAIEGIVLFDGSPIPEKPQPRKTSADFLDQIPFVSEFYLRHLQRPGIEKHFYASITWPYIQILTARGCPYKCSFCNIPSIGSYRTRSVDSVISEFKFIVEKMPFVKEIFIEDDTFPINKKRTIEICKRIISEKIKIKWSCNARVNTDLETLQWMKKAGCRLACVGFESPSTDALEGVIKKTSLAEQELFMKNANKAKIKINGCFILGLPGDTTKSIDNTIEYAKRLMPNTAQFYPHMVYPGTGSFEWAEKNNLLEHKDWEKWNTPEGFHNTPLKINGMSSADLLQFADTARKRFYTNPRYLIKMFFQCIKSPSELQRILIAGKTFFPLLLGYIFKKNP